MPSNHLSLYRPLLLLPLIFPSIMVFTSESVLCIRGPKYWSFRFNISPSSEYSGLISSRIDCLELLAVQGTFKSLLQHHSSKASILQWSTFFIVQLSHPYMTTEKTIALRYSEVICSIYNCIYNSQQYIHFGTQSFLNDAIVPSMQHVLIRTVPGTQMRSQQKV